MYGGGTASTLKGQTRHPAEAVGNERIGWSFYPLRHVSIRRPPLGRIILEATESRWVMRWCNNDAVRESTLATTIVGENCVRDDRSRSVTTVSIDMTSTPLAANTSKALAKAGSESACVSMPM